LTTWAAQIASTNPGSPLSDQTRPTQCWRAVQLRRAQLSGDSLHSVRLAVACSSSTTQEVASETGTSNDWKFSQLLSPETCRTPGESIHFDQTRPGLGRLVGGPITPLSRPPRRQKCDSKFQKKTPDSLPFRHKSFCNMGLQKSNILSRATEKRRPRGALVCLGTDGRTWREGLGQSRWQAGRPGVGRRRRLRCKSCSEDRGFCPSQREEGPSRQVGPPLSRQVGPPFVSIRVGFALSHCAEMTYGQRRIQS
jgi:hypothetical protein